MLCCMTGSADLLLHPVRLRIVQAFLGDRALTTTQLSAVERTYVLRLAAARIGPDELEAMSADDYRQMFLAYAAGLLADFDRYLEWPELDLVKDGVAFGIEGLWLDDAEFAELMQDLYR